MKALLSITLLLVSVYSFPLLAQQNFPKNNLKFGFGTSFYSGTDFRGKTQYVEYERQLFSRFSIGIDGVWGNATYTSDLEVKNDFNLLGLNAHLFFAPIRKSNNQLKLGIGAAVQQIKYTFEGINPQSEPHLPSDYKQSQQGFSVILEYEVFIIKNWSIGSRLNFQQFKEGSKNYFWGLNTGIRF